MQLYPDGYIVLPIRRDQSSVRNERCTCYCPVHGYNTGATRIPNFVFVTTATTSGVNTVPVTLTSLVTTSASQSSLWSPSRKRRWISTYFHRHILIYRKKLKRGYEDLYTTAANCEALATNVGRIGPIEYIDIHMTDDRVKAIDLVERLIDRGLANSKSIKINITPLKDILPILSSCFSDFEGVELNYHNLYSRRHGVMEVDGERPSAVQSSVPTLLPEQTMATIPNQVAVEASTSASTTHVSWQSVTPDSVSAKSSSSEEEYERPRRKRKRTTIHKKAVEVMKTNVMLEHIIYSGLESSDEADELL